MLSASAQVYRRAECHACSCCMTPAALAVRAPMRGWRWEGWQVVPSLAASCVVQRGRGWDGRLFPCHATARHRPLDTAASVSAPRRHTGRRVLAMPWFRYSTGKGPAIMFAQAGRQNQTCVCGRQHQCQVIRPPSCYMEARVSSVAGGGR